MIRPQGRCCLRPSVPPRRFPERARVLPCRPHPKSRSTTVPDRQKSRCTIDFRRMFPYSIRVQMAAMLDLYSPFSRQWLPPTRPCRRHCSWVEQDHQLQVCAPGLHLCTRVAQSQPNPRRDAPARRGRGLQEGRAQVHAAPSRQAEGQDPRLLTGRCKEVALGIAVTGICLYNPDECRSPGHSSGSGCAGPAMWSDQAPG
jgi:hypothetical protein